MSVATSRAARVPSIAVVGLGNIGSQVGPLLGCMPGILRVILIDHDRCSASNIGHQRMSAKDIGHLKVTVQARELRRHAPHIAVETYACPVEAVPLGKLRDCIIVACVDSRRARQSINRIAFHLGIPWIDAGLDRAGSVRARVYVPGADDCLECSWSADDYALLEQRVPCDAASSAVTATAAPVEFGAMAAGLQIMLLRRLLDDVSVEAGRQLAQQQWFLDLPSGRGWIGRYTPNPACRFDHARLPITPLARDAHDITLRETFALAGADAADAVFCVDGQPIVHCVRCTACGSVKKLGGRLLGRTKFGACKRCGGTMIPAAMDVVDCLTLNDASPEWLDRPLAAFGLACGDVISLHSRGAAAHFELGSAGMEEN